MGMAWRVPTFAVPDPPEISPLAGPIEDYVLALGERLGLTRTAEGRRRLDAGYGRLVAWTYPAADWQDLCLCAEWLFITFLLDDLHTLAVYDSAAAWMAIHRRIQAIIGTGQESLGQPSTPFTQTLADLSRRTRQRTSPAFYRRFAHHLDLFFQGFARESQHRQHREPPGVEEFIELRRLSVGMEFGFDLVELSHHVEVPEMVCSTSLYRDLLAAAADIIAWQNDVHSLDVDTRRGDLINLVIVLQHATGADQDTARDAACAKITQRLADFTAIEHRLPALLRTLSLDAPGRDAVLRNAAGMRQWTNGCLAWYQHTTRYTPSSPSPAHEHAYLQTLV